MAILPELRKSVEKWSERLHDLDATLILITPQKIATTKSFELWLLPAAKKAPISMGLIPASGKLNIKLSADLFAVLKQNMNSAVGMAVSLEPKDGSPTRPILYQAEINLI